MSIYSDLCAVTNVQQLQSVARKLWDAKARLELTQELISEKVLVHSEVLLSEECFTNGTCSDDSTSAMISNMRENDIREVFCVHMLQLIAYSDVSLTKFLTGLISKLVQ